MAAPLAARGIHTPFAIQSATIPDALAGRDVCGKAPTGSGKTIAFGIPLVLRCPPAEPHRPTGLVLVPTRELAAQVDHELHLLGLPLDRRVASAYGGVAVASQVRRLQKGVDLLVATPGRLLDLLSGGEVALDDVALLVIDEADRMADMGFLPDVTAIADRTPADRQTLLFSATLDGDVDTLVRRYQRHPVRHDVGAADDTVGEVRHLFWSVPHPDRVRVAAAVTERCGRTIVFCRTRYGADRVARQLDGWGVRAAVIHGDRSQPQRDRALRDFHDGRVSALVATDVAARGIHVDGVAAVVHYDPPADTKDYRHRSGRTGRAGTSGVVVSLVQPKVVGHVANLCRDLDLPFDLTDPDIGGLDPSRQPSPRRAGPPTATPGARRTPPETTGATSVRRPGSVGSVGAQPRGAGPRRAGRPDPATDPDGPPVRRGGPTPPRRGSPRRGATPPR